MRQVAALCMLVILLISGCTQSDPVEVNGATQTNPSPPEAVRSEEIRTMPNSSLSAESQQALLDAVAAQQNLSADQLQITEVKEVDWPDACLGLAGPDEFCAQMIIPGWAVSVSDGQQTWRYRTDLDMAQVKLDPS